MIYTFYRGELTEDSETLRVDAMYWEEGGMNMVAVFPAGYFNTDEVRQSTADRHMTGNHVFTYGPLRDRPGLRLGAFLGHVESVWKIPSAASWKVTFDPVKEEMAELRAENISLRARNRILESNLANTHTYADDLEAENRKLRKGINNATLKLSELFSG